MPKIRVILEYKSLIIKKWYILKNVEMILTNSEFDSFPEEIKKYYRLNSIFYIKYFINKDNVETGLKVIMNDSSEFILHCPYWLAELVVCHERLMPSGIYQPYISDGIQSVFHSNYVSSVFPHLFDIKVKHGREKISSMYLYYGNTHVGILYFI